MGFKSVAALFFKGTMINLKGMLKEVGGYATELGRFGLDMLYVEFVPKGLIKYDPEYEYTSLRRIGCFLKSHTIQFHTHQRVRWLL